MISILMIGSIALTVALFTGWPRKGEDYSPEFKQRLAKAGYDENGKLMQESP